jgi:glycosyltransferase involved in cell wall biosynthesis
MTPENGRAPWVLIAWGFHRYGGMDRANLELAEYLVEELKTPVHVVCHQVDADFARYPLVTVHHVPCPAGSWFLGGPLLDFHGRRVARRVTERFAEATVVVNGGNCIWPGVNWVHYVHRAWSPTIPGAPAWFKIKNGIATALARRDEKAAFEIASLIITNSNLTSRHIGQYFRVDPERTHTVYLGTDPEWTPVSAAEREASRRALQLPSARAVAVFVGALGHDNRKGFDVLFQAWRNLCARADWDVDLLAAGAGKAVNHWRQAIGAARLEDRIRVVGFSNNVKSLLAAADLLISPVRYEAYGLNVQEAICCGLPAIVSASAGVAERYPSELHAMLLSNPEDAGEIEARLICWRSGMESWKSRFRGLAAEFRTQTWRRMAEEFVSLVESRGRKDAPFERCPGSDATVSEARAEMQ